MAMSGLLGSVCLVQVLAGVADTRRIERVSRCGFISSLIRSQKDACDSGFGTTKFLAYLSTISPVLHMGTGEAAWMPQVS
jgi:hypothetical protein